MLRNPSTILKSLKPWNVQKYATVAPSQAFQELDTFPRRHIGPSDGEIKQMLEVFGLHTLDEFSDKIIPKSIKRNDGMNLDTIGPNGEGRGETAALRYLRDVAALNDTKVRSFIGMGYYPTVTPNVILRSLLENPGWYTPYTPYQAEIAQGRLQSLINYQTVIQELTGMETSNASLLDEATSAAEAMNMAFQFHKKKRDTFFVSTNVHPQTIAVLQTRAPFLGIKLVLGNHEDFNVEENASNLIGVLCQYPGTDGVVADFTNFVARAKATGAVALCATDLLALTVLPPPSKFGFEVAVGNSQRFGVPVGFGGPHAAFLAVSGKLKRIMPGRIIGWSVDTNGKPAVRMALQAREQHIKREKATSNICTAQALLANIAAMYAVFHGPKGLQKIGKNVQYKSQILAEALKQVGYTITSPHFFDTIKIILGAETITFVAHLKTSGFNVRNLNDKFVTISLDEPTTFEEVAALVDAAAKFKNKTAPPLDSIKVPQVELPPPTYLSQNVFNVHHSETNMLRYLFSLQKKDLGLNSAMIPLGSCTMKLNATAEMIPVTWKEFGSIHPFVPFDQAKGYTKMIGELERDLAIITGFAGVSLQPNAGSQGEYAGLAVITAYHRSKGQGHRNVCLIPVSAHGTNPASAAMVGLELVSVLSNTTGGVDMNDLRAKASQYKDNLSCIMVTYPSTYGVFEEDIKEICELIHSNGGQVYMDGANMNAQIGLTAPGIIGADVCHLNLHKTFSIPHGGGGPGVGPICVAKHLIPFLPNHVVVPFNTSPQSMGAVSAAPYGNAGVLPITWTYINMMGSNGLKKASQVAILNANYMAKKISAHFEVLFVKDGFCAHEFIISCASFAKCGITELDVAKRLMDYGFHPPTMSWPVHGTLMIEPTESESKVEVDRLINAFIAIRNEIKEVEDGVYTAEESVLRGAPHTLEMCMANNWTKKYPREKAAYPVAELRENKHWPTCSRIDDAYGDRNLSTGAINRM
jgi:glycine dehydrogenase